MIKKLTKSLLLLGLIAILIFQVAKAQTESEIFSNIDLERAFHNFIICMNRQDEEVYNYIDTSNEELYNNIKEYLFPDLDYYGTNSFRIKTDVKEITEENGIYNIKTTIRAEGEGINGRWSVSGFTANFEAKEIDGKYKITDTDLFDIIGTKNVGKFILMVFGIVFGIIALVILIIVLAVVFSLKKKKQPNDNNTNPIR